MEARKCYDTRPGTEIFWVSLIIFFFNLIKLPHSPTPPSPSHHTLAHTHRQPAAAVWPNSDPAYPGQNTSCVTSTVVSRGKFNKLTPPLHPPVWGFQAYRSYSTRIMRIWTLDEPGMLFFFFFFLTGQRGQTEFSGAHLLFFNFFSLKIHSPGLITAPRWQFATAVVLQRWAGKMRWARHTYLTHTLAPVAISPILVVLFKRPFPCLWDKNNTSDLVIILSWSWLSLVINRPECSGAWTSDLLSQ